VNKLIAASHKDGLLARNNRGNQVNAHEQLLTQWRSAYALSKQTGIPLTTAKRWRRRKCISDPAYWLPLISAAGMEPTQTCYELAKDYGAK